VPRYRGIAQALIEQVDNVQLAGSEPRAIDRTDRTRSAGDGDPASLPFSGRRLQCRGGAERGKGRVRDAGVIWVVGFGQAEYAPERVTPSHTPNSTRLPSAWPASSWTSELFQPQPHQRPATSDQRQSPATPVGVRQERIKGGEQIVALEQHSVMRYLGAGPVQ